MSSFHDRIGMLLGQTAISAAAWIGRGKRPLGDAGCDILVTGRFDAQNWILAHLVPLAESHRCSHLWMVSTHPVPAIPKVEAIYPPKWLARCIGATPARLVTFLWMAIRKRPHVVGGFHLKYNGIMAAIAGRLAGARSMYFCVGGTEVEHEGMEGEDNCFAKAQAGGTILRGRRLRIVANFDVIITMGSRAAEFFKNNAIRKDISVVSGGIDARRFYPGEERPSFDIILVARLSPEKRIDVFLQTVRFVADRVPDVKAVVIGDGELRGNLQELASDLGISQNVEFVGHIHNVEQWLRRSKVFALTSDLEGLPLSAMEAMMCGIPVVASRVGDLQDLVEDGVNGYLVPRRSPEALAERIVALLMDPAKWREFSVAARRSALRYELKATAKRWDDILVRM